jgi:hypothetical protein
MATLTVMTTPTDEMTTAAHKTATLMTMVTKVDRPQTTDPAACRTRATVDWRPSRGHLPETTPSPTATDDAPMTDCRVTPPAYSRWSAHRRPSTRTSLQTSASLRLKPTLARGPGESLSKIANISAIDMGGDSANDSGGDSGCAIARTVNRQAMKRKGEVRRTQRRVKIK